MALAKYDEDNKEIMQERLMDKELEAFDRAQELHYGSHHDYGEFCPRSGYIRRTVA